jgi:hypothetical protein
MPHLIHLNFGFINHFFLPNYHISTTLDLSHPLVLKVDSLQLWLAFRFNADPLFFVVSMVRNGLQLMIPHGILSLPSWECGVLCFTWVKSCPLVIFLLVFSLVGWHCVIDWWHSYFSQCYHYWSYLSIFGSVCCFILWGDRNDGNSSKGKTLPQLAFNKCISSLVIKVFDCLHQQVYNFFHWCANMVWSTKGTNGLPMVILCVFINIRCW